MDLVGIIGNSIVLIGILLLPLYVAKQLVPGPYRLVRRGMRRLGDFTMFRQAKRRGILFAIFVHFSFIVGFVLITLGLMTGTYGAMLPGLVFMSIALVVKRVLGALGRLRARHRSLPTWRR